MTAKAREDGFEKTPQTYGRRILTVHMKPYILKDIRERTNDALVLAPQLSRVATSTAWAKSYCKVVPRKARRDPISFASKSFWSVV